MFERLWWLADYPHIIGISSELKKEKSIKRFFYNTPIILVRNSENIVLAFFNVCPHKRALEIKSNKIYCPYHGWRFNNKWEITKIPSSPHLEKTQM